MLVEIVESTPIYPTVYVIEKGSLRLSDLSANIICKCHIVTAELLKKAVNEEHNRTQT